jgi:hypothetical protein
VRPGSVCLEVCACFGHFVMSHHGELADARRQKTSS